MTAPDYADLRRLLAQATPGRWKLWGMQVLADQDGTSNVDTSVPVASTSMCDEHGKPRTFDAALIAAAVNALPHLLDEREALIRERDEAWDEGRESGLADARPERSKDRLRSNPYRADATRSTP